MDEKTKKYVSVAVRPGTFGVKFHNEGYDLLKINSIYIPLKLEDGELKSFIPLIKNNFDGCSLSMPHKEKIIEYLSDIDESAKLIGAVNTVVNLGGGKLKGYNTDIFGAREAIRIKMKTLENKSVFMVGAGGVANAIAVAVLDLGGKLSITNRSEIHGRNLAKKLNSTYVPWEDKDKITSDLFINATPVGMSGEEPIISKKSISKFYAIMDVVVAKTPLIKFGYSQNKIIIPGNLMTINQAKKQFEIYTGKLLPESFLIKYMEKQK